MCRRRGAASPTLEAREGQLLCVLVLRSANPATDTAPTSTTKEIKEENESGDVQKTSQAALRTSWRLFTTKTTMMTPAPQLMLSGGRALSAQECIDLVLPHGPILLDMALATLPHRDLGPRLVAMSLGACYKCRLKGRGNNTGFPHTADSMRHLSTPDKKCTDSADAIHARFKLDTVRSCIECGPTAVIAGGLLGRQTHPHDSSTTREPPSQASSELCHLLLQLAVSLQHSDVHHTVLTSQLDVGWLPIVTHVTEILHLLSLDVQSQETILSVIKTTNGQTKIPLQHLSFSTTKKTINPMLC